MAKAKRRTLKNTYSLTKRRKRAVKPDRLFVCHASEEIEVFCSASENAEYNKVVADPISNAAPQK